MCYEQIIFHYCRSNHDCTFKNNDNDDTSTATKNTTSDVATATTTVAVDEIQRCYASVNNDEEINDNVNNNKEKDDNAMENNIEKVAQGVEDKHTMIDDDSTKNEDDDEVINQTNEQ